MEKGDSTKINIQVLSGNESRVDEDSGLRYYFTTGVHHQWTIDSPLRILETFYENPWLHLLQWNIRFTQCFPHMI
jgi:hypothetical protein